MGWRGRDGEGLANKTPDFHAICIFLQPQQLKLQRTETQGKSRLRKMKRKQSNSRQFCRVAQHWLAKKKTNQQKIYIRYKGAWREKWAAMHMQKVQQQQLEKPKKKKWNYNYKDDDDAAHVVSLFY